MMTDARDEPSRPQVDQGGAPPPSRAWKATTQKDIKPYNVAPWIGMGVPFSLVLRRGSNARWYPKHPVKPLRMKRKNAKTPTAGQTVL